MIRTCVEMGLQPCPELLGRAPDKESVDQPVTATGDVFVGEAQPLPACGGRNACKVQPVQISGHRLSAGGGDIRGMPHPQAKHDAPRPALAPALPPVTHLGGLMHPDIENARCTIPDYRGRLDELGLTDGAPKRHRKAGERA